jgi:hypothetical protein
MTVCQLPAVICFKYSCDTETIIEWPSIGPAQDEWEKASRRPAETVLDEMMAKFQSLEWVPYRDSREKDGGLDPPAREIMDDPIVMQNLFPGGIRLPPDTTAAIQSMRQQNGPDGADELRRSINRLRAWQKIYRDCGWGSGNLDGEAFERKRVHYVEALDDLERLEANARYRSSPGASQQPFVIGDMPTLEVVLSRLDHFLVQAAGEYAV